MSSNMSSPSPNSNTSFLGDYIGMESCVDLKNNEGIVYASNNSNSDVYNQIRDKRDQWCAMKKKEFPPLISLLAAHTENLPSQMPWLLKRQYTSDGRLVLTEERVKHHEYLQAHRSNGRLTLQLVHLDDNDEEEEEEEEEDIEKDSSENVEEEAYVETEVVDDDNNGDSINGVDNDYDINVEEEEEEIVHKNEEEGLEGSSVVKYESSSSMENGKSGTSNGGNRGAGAGAGAGAKRLNYNSVRTSSSCFLGMPVPAAIRPVHT